MTTKYSSFILLIVLHLLLAGAVFSGDDATLEFSLTNGFTDNVLADSSSLNDNFTTVSSVFNLYPFSNLEIGLSGDYTYYSDLFRISNYNYQLGFTYIPLKDSSRFSVYLNGSFNQREYKTEDNLDIPNDNFNSKDYKSTLSFGYSASDVLSLRTGLNYKHSDFDIKTIDNKYAVELFTGLNYSLLNSFSLDIEAGYSFENIYFLPVEKELFPGTGIILPYPILPDSQYVYLDNDKLRSFYFSPRLSRSLGSKTGVSLTYYNKSFKKAPADPLVYGYSAGFLSPWVSTYEGEAVLLKVKTFLVPKIIVELGAGYWDKRFFNTLETVYINIMGDMVPTLHTQNAAVRDDDMRRFYFKLQYPCINKETYYFEPTLNVDYTSNSSSVDVYDYTGLTVQATLKILLF